jgi:hypothetical protein
MEMKMRTVTTAIAAAVILAACGGGGSNNSTPAVSAASAEGQYTGNTNTNQAVVATVLDSGKYYAQYSAAGNPAVIAGVVVGTVSSTNGTLSGGGGTDYNLQGAGVTSATLSGTYTAKASINGTVTYSNGAKVTLSGSYDSTYDATPALATAQGNYAGTSVTALGSDVVILTADASGNITGKGTNCPFTGVIKPHARGNVYDISLTFSTSAGCAYPGTTATGIGLLSSSNKAIHAMLQTPSNAGILFVGTKP